MRETAIDRAFKSGSPEAKDVAFWAFRAATSHADQAANPAKHARWIQLRLNDAINRFEPSERHATPEEKPVAPISLEEAKLRSELLKASI